MTSTAGLLQILGGGPAGLAAAYYAGRAGRPVRLYEAGDEVGGNARTRWMGPFGFDTGAHRVHDRIGHVTDLFREWLGDDLRRIHVPSQIYWQGRLVDFPLSPYDLTRKLPPPLLRRIVAENVRLRLRPPRQAPSDFAAMVRRQYGDTLASLFLLGYSEQLWGVPPDELAVSVAGKRLKGLDLRTFLLEALAGRRAKTTHLDGAFYYPRLGFGTVMDAAARHLPPGTVHTSARITRLEHNGRRLHTLYVNDAPLPAATVINALPLTITLRLLHPAPPRDVQEAAASIRYRHLRLGILALDVPRLTPNASLYIPDPDLPFTRIYEPKNRSSALAPPSQTALVFELPCAQEDDVWQMPDAALQALLESALATMGLAPGAHTVAFGSMHLPFAYPVLTTHAEAAVAPMLRYLARFENLHLLGRSARFEYTHVHDLFDQARALIERLGDG